VGKGREGVGVGVGLGTYTHEEVDGLFECWDGLFGFFHRLKVFHSIFTVPLPLSNQS